MKVCCKTLVAMALVVCMALGMTGCGSKPVDGSQIVAMVGEKEVSLGEVNFLLRYQQVQMESYYESMLGEGIYEMDLYGTGLPYGEEFKADVMEQMQEYYVLEAKAADYGVALTEEEETAITEAATAFLAANDDYTKEQMTADQATVERVLTLMTINSKMTAAIKEEADVTVTDEEVVQRGFSYVSMSKLDSEGEALTDADLQAAKDKLTAVIASVEAGNTMDAAAVENGLTSYPGNYGEATEVFYDEALIAALKETSEGDVTGIVETEKELYIAIVTADVDEEATADRRETVLGTKQTEYFNNVLKAWLEEYPLNVNAAIWADVVFDRSYETKAN